MCKYHLISTSRILHGKAIGQRISLFLIFQPATFSIASSFSILPQGKNPAINFAYIRTVMTLSQILMLLESMEKIPCFSQAKATASGTGP